jgi:glucose/arabinose dehydrogenase
MKQLKLPDGFHIEKFAEGLGKPRIIAVNKDGTVYLTRREPGDCLMLRDTDGDGKADLQKVVAQKPDLHGVTIRNDKIYFVAVKEVYVADIRQDGTLGELQRIVADLPDAGQHADRTLAFGPDGMLYVSVGSTCNECPESNKENATIVRFHEDGSGREIFAKGLRNTVGFAWHPLSNELWGADHGIDWLGDTEQKEEFNHLTLGKHYGWPYVFADGKVNVKQDDPQGTTKAELARTAEKPVLLYTAHAAPMQVVFYTATQFPPEYRNNAFITMHGSWNTKPPAGYEIVQVKFDNGKPIAMEPFLSGFLFQQSDGTYSQFGRPVGLATWKDGSLLLSDDDGGVVYRISYGTTSIVKQQ